MHSDKPFDPVLQQWLDRYLPLPRKPGPRGPTFYERKRAELVAKKARADALMNLRATVLKKSARLWPRLREARQADKENGDRMARVKEREAKAKVEAARERAAADARVAHLMALRALQRASLKNFT